MERINAFLSLGLPEIAALFAPFETSLTVLGVTPLSESMGNSGYAVETIAKAQDLGILYGYEDNTIRPKNTLSRAEGVALLMNLVECLEAA